MRLSDAGGCWETTKKVFLALKICAALWAWEFWLFVGQAFNVTKSAAEQQAMERHGFWSQVWMHCALVSAFLCVIGVLCSIYASRAARPDDGRKVYWVVIVLVCLTVAIYHFATDFTLIR